MSTFSQLQHELADSERHLAEAQERFARQADLVRELYADGPVRTFPAKRLLVLAQNLNSMERHRRQIVRELRAAQKSAASSLPH
jgi:uncharacterized membrane protein YccC